MARSSHRVTQAAGMRTLRHLYRLPKPLVITLAFILVGLVGLLDFFTGWELSFSIFYVLPIVLVAYRAGNRWGSCISLVCAATWLINEIATNPHYTHPAFPYWNGLV